MVLCLRLICLDLLLYMLFLGLAYAAILSQCIQIIITGLDHIGMSKKFLNHFASSLALSRATNSSSIAECAILVCLEDFQETIALPVVKTYPLVNLVFVLSEIQFA